MGKYTLKAPRGGVDVSQWQGEIDWEALAPWIDFAIIRLGSGYKTDKFALANQKACADNGIPYGVYWFSYAATAEMAEREAECCLTQCNGKLAYPVYFDYETESMQGRNLSQSAMSEIAAAFCDKVESQRYYAGIYCSTNFKGKYNSGTFARYDLWEANWSKLVSARIQQISNAGKLPGIGANVDLNLCYYDYPALMADKKFNGYRKG